MTSSTIQTSQWLRDRAIGKYHRGPQITTDSVRRLQLESKLEGHSGCVNCLQWNRSGCLLASGSDDHKVIIWDPFRANKRHLIKTGHTGSIFSVNFTQDFSDDLIATCGGDGQVKLINILSNEHVLNCHSCHVDRVKRLATHPSEPHLLWSAGEDGFIMQYDFREEHSCRTAAKPKNLLVDLKIAGKPLAAKCLAINPARSEMLAVGANDVFVRLFDRRCVRKDSLHSSVAYFTPGHLIASHHKPYPKSSGATYLTFSPNGAELLANIHADQVYLFSTYEPWEKCKSFEKASSQRNQALENDPQVQLRRNSSTPFGKTPKYTKLPEKHREFFQLVQKRINSKIGPSMIYIEKINEILEEYKDCAELYYLRASALIRRGWRGDYHQAMRDCCSAFALNSIDYSSLFLLPISALCNIDDVESATRMLGELIKIVGFFDPRLQQDIRVFYHLSKSSLNRPVSRAKSDSRTSLSPDGDRMLDEDENDEDTSLLDDWVFSLVPHPDENRVSFDDSDYDTQIFGTMFNEQTCEEEQRILQSFNYCKRFCGHCNMNTDIKEVNFFGSDGQFIVGGSDDGAFYIWNKTTTNIVKAVYGDTHILNCLQPHPSICMLATSGIESLVKLWSPSGKANHDVKNLEQRCCQNQEFIASDPLEAMIMRLYPDRWVQ